MGITIFKIFICGGISTYICSEVTSHVTVKLNFQPYIQRYTSPNENFEYSYPLVQVSNLSSERDIKLTSVQKKVQVGICSHQRSLISHQMGALWVAEGPAFLQSLN